MKINFKWIIQKGNSLKAEHSCHQLTYGFLDIITHQTFQPLEHYPESLHSIE